MRSLSRLLRFVFFCSFIFVLLTPLSWAQAVSGAIEGTITDASGGVVPGVEIVVLHRETNSIRNVVTNERGYYRLEQLPIGSYEVTASVVGFKKAATDPIAVTLGSPITVNIVLQVGDVSEKVVVLGAAPQIQLSSNEMERNVSDQQILELPNIDRDPSKLLQLFPAVPAITQDKNGSLTVGGLRPRSTVYNVDGSNNLNFLSSGQRTPVIMEAVAEMRAVTNVYSAQYGRGAGAVVDSVLKSGTNDFHGSLFYYYRGTALNANSFFANARGLGKEQYIQNLWGGTAGGPVVKNKAFFFAAFEGTNQRTKGIELIRIPSSSFRTPLLDDPLSLAKDPVVGNLITQVFALLPPCSSTGATCDYSSLQPNNLDQYAVTTKFDYLISNRDALAGRLLYRTGNTLAGSILASRNGKGDQTDTNVAISYRRLFTPRLVNELIFTLNTVDGITQVPGAILPDVSISGLSAIGAPSNYPQGSAQRYYQVVDNLSHTIANHTMKFGADLLWSAPEGYAEFNGRGVYQFLAISNASLGTLDALKNFRLGRAYDIKQGKGDFERRFTYLDLNFYLQDDWKLTRSLTLNLGLRYDLQTSPKVLGINSGIEGFEAFDPQTRQFTNWQNDTNNVSPSLGFAWDPTGKGSTVLRGGFRRAFDRIPNDFYNIGAILQAPFVQTFSATLPSPTTIPFGKGQEAAKEAGLAIFLMLTPDFKLSYADTWHLSVQRRIMKDTVFEIGYLGTAGRDMAISVQYNRFNPITGQRPDPKLSTVTLADDTGYSNYHGLTSMLRRQFRHGLAYTASYTWSKALDINHDAVAPFGGEGGGQVAVAHDAQDKPILNLEYGRAIFNRTHAFSSSVVWQMPKLVGQAFLGAVLNDWQVSAMVFLQTGNPFTILAGADLNQDSVNNDRPDLLDVSLLKRGAFDNPDELMPRAAFGGAAQPRRIGNLGRNTFTRDGVANVDLALVKRFPISLREGMGVEFRSEFFNFFNTPRFGIPTSTLTSGSFGQIQSQENSPRRIRMTLKFTF